MTNSSDSGQKPESSRRASKVWTALAEMFGNVFLNQFGENPPSVWMAQVEQLSDEELRRGLTNIGNDGLKFPPNLSQFVAACKRLPAVRKLGVPQIEDQRPAGRMSRKEWIEKNST